MNEKVTPTKLEEIIYIVTGRDMKYIQERFKLEPLRRHDDGYFIIRVHDKLDLTIEDVKVEKKFFEREETRRFQCLAIEATQVWLLSSGRGDIKKLSDVRERLKKTKAEDGFPKIGKYIAASIIGLAGIVGLGFGSYKLYRNHQFDINVRVVQEAIDSKDYEYASNLLYEFTVGGRLREKDRMDLDSIIGIEKRKISFERAQESAKEVSDKSVEIAPVAQGKDLTPDLKGDMYIKDIEAEKRNALPKGNLVITKEDIMQIAKIAKIAKESHCKKEQKIKGYNNQTEFGSIENALASTGKVFTEKLFEKPMVQTIPVPTFSAKDYHSKALVHYKEGNHSEAISELRRAIQQDPKLAVAYVDLGIILNAQKDFNGAREAYQKASQLDPSNIDVQKSLEQVLNSHIQYLRGCAGPRGLVQSQDLESILKQVDQHLILPKGRYAIDFDITIKPSSIFDINPGTELYFGSNGGIISYGILDAKGTEKEKILFTALKDEWKNITIAGKFANGSVLEYCDISKGGGRVEELKSDEVNYDAGGGGAILIASSNPIIRFCKIHNNKTYFGGGLALYESNGVIESNFLNNNYAIRVGGGLYLEKSTALLKGNTITDNVADVKGGGIWLIESNAKFKENTISGNKVIYSGSGGGVFVSKSNSVFHRNTFKGNNCIEFGGGLAIYNSTVVLTQNVIENNRSERYSGGGLYLKESDGKLIDNTIRNNYAALSGGGICLDKSNPFIQNNNITKNRTNGEGGGIEFSSSSPILEKNIINENFAHKGGGLYFDENSYPNLRDNVITHNEAYKHGGGLCLWRYHKKGLRNNKITNNKDNNIDYNRK